MICLHDLYTLHEEIKQEIPALSLEINKGELIVYPNNNQEMASFIKYCNEKKIQVIPAGSRTILDNLRHGSNIILSTARMNRIIELAKEDLTVTVESGIQIKELTVFLKQYNFILPVSYQDKPASTIGGLLARDAGGLEEYNHGAISDYVLGLEFVAPTGELIKTGGKTVKNVSGYDFTRFFVRSWGSLGIITKATFKLKPVAEEKCLLISLCKNPIEALEIMEKVFRQKFSAVTFLGMPTDYLGISSGEPYVVLFVLAGSKMVVTKQTEDLSKILKVDKQVAGRDEVDKSIEKIYAALRSLQLIDYSLQMDRKWLFTQAAKLLSSLDNQGVKHIFIDAGRGQIEIKSKQHLPELADYLKQTMTAPDILYTKLKKSLDPNHIMAVENPWLAEVNKI
ncbi:MAG: FAD-binding oxidoreductase [Bacillota bacterium]